MVVVEATAVVESAALVVVGVVEAGVVESSFVVVEAGAAVVVGVVDAGVVVSLGVGVGVGVIVGVGVVVGSGVVVEPLSPVADDATEGSDPLDEAAACLSLRCMTSCLALKCGIFKASFRCTEEFMGSRSEQRRREVENAS